MSRLLDYVNMRQVDFSAKSHSDISFFDMI